MKIEEGKYYMTRDGRKVGPARMEYGTWNVPWEAGPYFYDEYGYSVIDTHKDDIIAEWYDGETGTLKELNVRPGDVVECVRRGGAIWWTEGKLYTVKPCGTPADGQGTTYEHFADPQPAIKFRIISRASDTPRTWGEMTAEEKGALLLAHHEGKAIEWYRHDGSMAGKWRECPKSVGKFNHYAYRVRPEPEPETVKVYYGSTYGASLVKDPLDTHRITFITIDGEPDCDSIRMERIDG